MNWGGDFMTHRLLPGTPCSQPFFIWLAINWMIFTQSLHRKCLEITKHLFINGCLGFQVFDKEKQRRYVRSGRSTPMTFPYNRG